MKSSSLRNISVIMPAYNRRNLLEIVLPQILNQSIHLSSTIFKGYGMESFRENTESYTSRRFSKGLVS
ncbi:MAG: hypothetical protein ACK4SU_02305, partial [Dictyoglomus sp.]